MPGSYPTSALSEGVRRWEQLAYLPVLAIGDGLMGGLDVKLAITGQCCLRTLEIPTCVETSYR